MKARTLIILGAVTVAALLATTLLEKGSAPDTGAAADIPLYPGLKDQLNVIDRIALVSGESEIDLEKSDSGWTVAQRSGYPADSGKIRQLLLRLSEATILEAKTSNPELYARLAVNDPEAEEGPGTLLTIGAPADVRLIVGERDSRAGGTYVRREGEAQSYLIGVEIEAGSDPVEWLDREVLDIDGAAIREMAITHEDGETLRLIRVGDQLVAAGVPKGRELSGPAATQPMSRILSPLRLDDVMPMDEFDSSAPEAIISVYLDDGRKITARAWRRDDERWMAFDVTLEPSARTEESQPGKTGSTEPEPAEATGDATPSGENAATEAPEIERADPEVVARQDAALAGWVYRVPVYKYDQAVRRMEDLLKPAAE